MLVEGAIMLDYAHTKNCCYYAQNYASIVCQTLVLSGIEYTELTNEITAL